MMRRNFVTNEDKARIARVQRKVKQWGGAMHWVTLDFVKQWPGDKLVQPSICKDAFFIDWKLKWMFLVASEMESVDAPLVIHEVGHVFGCQVSPERSNERWFLGFEYALARELNLVNWWRRSLDNYVYDSGDPETGVVEDSLGAYSDQQFMNIMRDEVQRGEFFGNVVDGKATPIR
jgi:hypothetical protein